MMNTNSVLNGFGQSSLKTLALALLSRQCVTFIAISKKVQTAIRSLGIAVIVVLDHHGSVPREQPDLCYLLRDAPLAWARSAVC